MRSSIRAMPDSVIGPVRPAFRAIAETVVPESSSLPPSDWSELEAIVERALAQRPVKVRRQLGLLIRIIDLLPVIATGRRFVSLDAAGRERWLARLQGAPVLLLRRGVWGLRTLVFMGYYARPAAAAAIGYRADRRGWDARR
jgi:hypothetical protein